MVRFCKVEWWMKNEISGIFFLIFIHYFIHFYTFSYYPISLTRFIHVQHFEIHVLYHFLGLFKFVWVHPLSNSNVFIHCPTFGIVEVPQLFSLSSFSQINQLSCFLNYPSCTISLVLQLSFNKSIAPFHWILKVHPLFNLLRFIH